MCLNISHNVGIMEEPFSTPYENIFGVRVFVIGNKVTSKMLKYWIIQFGNDPFEGNIPNLGNYEVVWELRSSGSFYEDC